MKIFRLLGDFRPFDLNLQQQNAGDFVQKVQIHLETEVRGIFQAFLEKVEISFLIYIV